MVRAVAPTASLCARTTGHMPDAAFNPAWSPDGRGPGRASARDHHDDPVRRNPQRVLDGELSAFPAGLDSEIVAGDRSSNLAPPPTTNAGRTTESNGLGRRHRSR
jgi:hypothetical protein